MARKARRKAGSSIYHVMMRGNNRQQIFEDAEDENRFLALLKLYRRMRTLGAPDDREEQQETQYMVYAYCLMGNHVHLLIECRAMDIGEVMLRISTAYAVYYNRKYHHSGHVFQGRFRSEPIETEKYFLTVFRYILRNPVKAGICAQPGEYSKSAYGEYFGKCHRRICECSYLKQLADREELERFVNEAIDDACMDMDKETAQLTDAQAKELISKVTGIRRVNEFQILDSITRDELLAELIATEKLPIHQISRLTGISYGIVQRAGI